MCRYDRQWNSVQLIYMDTMHDSIVLGMHTEGYWAQEMHKDHTMW